MMYYIPMRELPTASIQHLAKFSTFRRVRERAHEILAYRLCQELGL